MKDKTIELHNIYRCLQLLQQRKRNFGAVTRDGLSLLEVHVLTEGIIQPDSTPSLLAELLCIDKALLSKVTNRLARRKLIKITKNPSDRRLINITVSKQGIKSLKDFDDRMDTVWNELSEHMADKDIMCIANLFNKIADVVNIPPSKLRENEQPIRQAQRRITRAFGILKSQFSLIQFGTSEWHVLNEIHESKNTISAQNLSFKISLAKNTVSQIISSLVSRGYLLQKPIPSKNYSKQLVILEKGIEVLKRNDEQIIGILDQATKNCSAKEIRDIRVTFEKYIGYLGNGKIRISETITSKLIDDHQEKREVRGFAIKCLNKLDMTETTPEKFFPHDAICLAFYTDDKIIAAAQIEHRKSFARKLLSPSVTFFTADTAPRLKEMPETIKTAVKLFSTELKFGQANLEFDPNKTFPANELIQ